VNAGHPSPINLDDVGPIELSPGPVIGLFPDAHWTSTPLPPLPAGMLLYTDGLTEGRAVPGSHERWGDQRLLATVAAELRARRPHAELPLSLIRAATAAQGDELPDDVAISSSADPGYLALVDPAAPQTTAAGRGARAGRRSAPRPRRRSRPPAELGLAAVALSRRMDEAAGGVT
jgi:hypothetical protein